jgi:uncharacterized membrane protein YdjX (TVP38/TMEM64 family)
LFWVAWLALIAGLIFWLVGGTWVVSVAAFAVAAAVFTLDVVRRSGASAS